MGAAHDHTGGAVRESVDMIIVRDKIKKEDLLQNAEVIFEDDMIKAVVDIENSLLAIDAELHSDLENLLLDNGSKQEALWGINLYPAEDDDFIEYDSLINIRRRQNNRSRGIEDPEVQAIVDDVVYRWII